MYISFLNYIILFQKNIFITDIKIWSLLSISDELHTYRALYVPPQGYPFKKWHVDTRSDKVKALALSLSLG